MNLDIKDIKKLIMNLKKNNIADLFQVNYATTQQPQKVEDIFNIEEMEQKYKPEGVGLIELARYDTLTVERIPNFSEGYGIFYSILFDF